MLGSPALEVTESFRLVLGEVCTHRFGKIVREELVSPTLAAHFAYLIEEELTEELSAEMFSPCRLIA